MARDNRYLVEVFLPLADNEGNAFPESAYETIEQSLTEKFGGVTTYPRSPASGKWRKSQIEHQDELIVYEVMSEDLDNAWWDQYRWSLEKTFRQEHILIRATEVQLL